MSELEHALRRAVEGDVRFDRYSRLLYSTDASMYQVEPIGVVIPRHADDVQAVLEVANRLSAPLLARGGGTSLAGQTVNHAVVLDFSRYMNGVLEVNAEELWARVQPGLVQDELNHHVRGQGLLFGPDTSTSNRATLGGMLGNNSGGTHSIAYGLTVEHVIELKRCSPTAAPSRSATVTPAEFAAKMRLPGLEGQIYPEVARIREQYREEIARRFRGHWRRVCGYNLDELVKDGPLNMARLLVGSEGTLLTIVEAKVRLVRRPKQTALDVIHYRDIQEALESSQAILETGPYAVELTDKMILDLARGNIEHRKRMAFVQGDPAAILIVEYTGDTEAEVRDKVEKLEAAARASASATPATSPWTPPSSSRSGSSGRRGWGSCSGSGATPSPSRSSRTPRWIPSTCRRSCRASARSCAKHGAEGAYYGHCSVGCLHIRPLINLKTHAGPRAGAGHGRGDLRHGARVRRRHLQRARRRPGAEPVPRARVRPHAVPGLPRAQGGLRPEEPHEPRQDRGQPGRHREPALRRPVQDLGAADAARLLRAGRLRRRGGDVQRRGRVPEEARGHHVPLLHGHAGRGALHPRPRQRAPRRALRPRAGRPSSPASGSTRSWTSASSARAARRSARPTSTWPS